MSHTQIPIHLYFPLRHLTFTKTFVIIYLFDTSDYPWPNEYNIERKNKKVPGLFTDELKSKVMVEFVGLRAKCYALRLIDKKDNVIKKSKGIKKCVVKRKIKFDDFVNCFKEHCELNKMQKTIRSIKHNVFNITQTKIALNPCDDKRFIRKNQSHTLAWGHYKIPDM